MADAPDPSRIPKFYQESVARRLDVLRERGLLADRDYQLLESGRPTLAIGGADRMVENVIGVFGLPLALGLNFRVNGKPYAVPMVIEEPSIVAGISSAAKLVSGAGGFQAESAEPLLIGQIQIVAVADGARAKSALLEAKADILNLANSLHPSMVARGGGARDVEVALHPGTAAGDMVVVHLLVDTSDAMGANFVNSMCEGIAPLVEKISGGKVFLRILSNLTDRALVRARAAVPVEALAGKGYAGEEVRDGIVAASELARVDLYRAVTHNKGVMNGIDAVALATGNDWRAIEAAAHAWAGRGAGYLPLTDWRIGPNGELAGSLEMPLKVGIVGGSSQSNPAAGINLRLLGVGSARELAEVMGAVGLAQNLAALRALVTQGIQQGHMTLHARSVAMAAGASPEHFDAVVDRLVEGGDIKLWRAEEIVADIEKMAAAELGRARKEEVGWVERKRSPSIQRSPHDELRSVPPILQLAGGEKRGLARSPLGAGIGKVILLGEHAVVYGSHAIAAPVPLAIEARVEDRPEGIHLLIPSWGVEEKMLERQAPRDSIQQSLGLILDRLGLEGRAMGIEVFPHIPRAMGLGSSAALAVAVIRALIGHYGLAVDDERVCAIAFECEKIAHGTPSGIDNTLATYGRPILFKRGDPPERRELRVPKPIPIVLGVTGVESLTARMVARVREAWQRNESLYDGIFREIDALAMQATAAIGTYDLPRLGELMNVNQGLLNALGVSSQELERLIHLAREHGALGAKLTGGGGGGSVVAVCPDSVEAVATAMRESGYRAIVTQVG